MRRGVISNIKLKLKLHHLHPPLLFSPPLTDFLCLLSPHFSQHLVLLLGLHLVCCLSFLSLQKEYAIMCAFLAIVICISYTIVYNFYCVW